MMKTPTQLRPYPKDTHRKNEAGVMLLEALVAMTIFLVGILGLIALQTRAAQISLNGQLRSSASFFAGQVISEMRLVSPASLASTYSTGNASYTAWANIVKDPQTGLPGANLTPNAPTITISTTATGTQRAIIQLQWQGPGEANPHNYTTIAEF